MNNLAYIWWQRILTYMSYIWPKYGPCMTHNYMTHIWHKSPLYDPHYDIYMTYIRSIIPYMTYYDHVWPIYDLNDPCMTHIWPIYDIYTIHIWPMYDLYDPYMTLIWPMYDLYMTHIWPTYDLYDPYIPYMTHIWPIYTHTWPIYDLYMTHLYHIWPIYDPYITHIHCEAKKTSPFLFFNNSVKSWPILIIFGTWKPEEIWHQMI